MKALAAAQLCVRQRFYSNIAALKFGSRQYNSQIYEETEDDMEQALMATQLVFYLLGGTDSHRYLG